jgi:hypothetical protein
VDRRIAVNIDRRKLLTPLLAGLTPLVFASTGLAAMSEDTWDLTLSNTFADGPIWATVNIKADTADGTVMFTVDAMDVQPQYGTLNNFGIDAFGFNYNGNVDGPANWSVALPSSWSESYDKNLSEFGLFLVKEQGTGSTRQDPLMFTLTLDTFSQAVAGNFAFGSDGGTGEFFAAHIAGINQGDGEGDIGSHWVSGSSPHVPAPGAAILAMIGFGLIGKIKRRLG